MPLFTDVVVWLPSANVLVMGDLMTNGSYPVIDESSCGYPCVEWFGRLSGSCRSSIRRPPWCQGSVLDIA